MIDRLGIMSPTLNLYGLRTRAGFAAERPEVVVESLSNYARLAAGMVKAGDDTPESLRRDARALRNVLDEVAKFPKLDAARTAEVRAEIAALTSSLGNELAGTVGVSGNAAGTVGVGSAGAAGVSGNGGGAGGNASGASSSPTMAGNPLASFSVASTKSQWIAAGVSPSAGIRQRVETFQVHFGALAFGIHRRMHFEPDLPAHTSLPSPAHSPATPVC